MIEGSERNRSKLDSLETWEALASLTEKSLVQYDGAGRWQILESMRIYAREKLLDSGERDNFHSRHLEFYRELAEDAEEHLQGADQSEWLKRLEDEHANLRWALNRAEQSDAGAGLQLAGAIWRFWYVRGYFAEGREILSNLLSAGGADSPTEDRAKTLTGAGVLAYSQGDYDVARTHFEESLAIRRELNDEPGIASMLNNLGNVAYDQADYASARTLFEESLAIRRRLGEQRGVAATLNNLGNVLNELGDFDGARELFEESLALKKAIGDQWGIGYSVSNLGNVAFNQGDYAAALARFEESLAVRRELGDRAGEAISLNNLGTVYMAQDDVAIALNLFRESLNMRKELGDRWGIAFSLEGIAQGEAALGRIILAASLWGASEKLREDIRAPVPLNYRPTYQRSVAEARAKLNDDPAFDVAWQEGRANRLDRAIDLALQKPSH